MIRPEQIPGLQAMKSINAFWVANPQTNRSNLRCFPHPSPRHSNSGSLDDVSHTWRPWKKSSALLRKERGWESAGQTLWDCVPVYGRRFGRLGGPWVFQVLANTQVMCGCWNETFFSNLLRILFRAQQAFPFSPVISAAESAKKSLGNRPFGGWNWEWSHGPKFTKRKESLVGIQISPWFLRLCRLFILPLTKDLARASRYSWFHGGFVQQRLETKQPLFDMQWKRSVLQTVRCVGGRWKKTSRANVTDRLEPRLRLSSVESAGFAQISRLAAMFKCFLSKFFVHLVRQIEL